MTNAVLRFRPFRFSLRSSALVCGCCICSQGCRIVVFAKMLLPGSVLTPVKPETRKQTRWDFAAGPTSLVGAATQPRRCRISGLGLCSSFGLRHSDLPPCLVVCHCALARCVGLRLIFRFRSVCRIPERRTVRETPMRDFRSWNSSNEPEREEHPKRLGREENPSLCRNRGGPPPLRPPGGPPTRRHSGNDISPPSLPPGSRNVKSFP